MEVHVAVLLTLRAVRSDGPGLTSFLLAPIRALGGDREPWTIRTTTDFDQTAQQLDNGRTCVTTGFR